MALALMYCETEKQDMLFEIDDAQANKDLKAKKCHLEEHIYVYADKSVTYQTKDMVAEPKKTPAKKAAKSKED